jgi:homeobox protein cut-like
MDVSMAANHSNSQDASTKDENKFQKAIAAWRSKSAIDLQLSQQLLIKSKDIDLSTLVPTLDGAASDLVAHQRDALVQRKDLAQKTKDFRKLDDAGKLVEIKALLKSYQTYIDLITNQSKATHSAFLQVYSPLAEAPDPYPLLEASIDSLVTAEETVPKLTEETENLQKQASTLSSQLEDTEKRLDHEREARQQLETSRDEKIKSIEASWTAVLNEKQNNWEAKEKALEEKIEHQDRLIKEIKASYEVSQRLNKDETSDVSRPGPTAAELEIVHSELDRANSRLAEVEARNEQLRLELAQSASQSDTTKSTPIDDDPAFIRLQSENSSLLRRLESSRIEKSSEKRKWDDRLRGLEREMAGLKSDRESLKQKLAQCSDYDNLKQELEVLKVSMRIDSSSNLLTLLQSIEFATGDDDQEQDATSSADDNIVDSNGATNKESLERLLLSRNKKLSNELTLLRVSHQDLQSKLETLEDELSNANMELEKSRNLTAVLENDLEKVQQEAANNFPSSAMSVAGTYTSRYPHSSYKSMRGARSTSPTSSIISGFDPSASPGGLESLRQGEAGGSSSILPMVTAQRDRFKKKMTELEAELQKSYQTIQSLRSEVAALQKDNLNLYEKTRYVSTYNRTSSSAAYAANTPPTAIQIDSNTNSEPTLHRYRSAYEANISPFSAFRTRESARLFKRMSLPERGVFQVSKMVLATRMSRNLFAMYCLGLHILVLVMLFHMGDNGSQGIVTIKPAAGAVAGGSTDWLKGADGKGG